MVKSVLHFFKIHGKVIFGNTSVVVQDMLRKTPKTFNAVNVVFRFLIDHAFRVVHLVMLSQTLEGVVAPKGVGVVDRALPRFLSNDGHKLFFRHMLHNSRIDPSITLQEAENDVFASRAASSLSLPPAAEVRLVHLDLTVQFFAFKFSEMIDRFSKTLVYSCDRLVIHVEVMRKAVRRLLLVEPLYDSEIFLQLCERLLFSTDFVPAPNVAARGSIHLERTAKNALFPFQKVGRAPENVVSPCNHKDILVLDGYDYH